MGGNSMTNNKTALSLLKQKYKQKLLENIKTSNQKTLDLSLIWQDTDDLDELYKQLSDLKNCLDSFRPLSDNEVKKLNEFFDIEYTYHSNKIEGNTLTLNETHLVINKGITIGSKSLNEHLEAVNHQWAIDYVRELVKDQVEFNKFELLSIHQLILQSIDTKNAGKYRTCEVLISGSRHIPPSHLLLDELMADYFDFYQTHKDSLHPVALASEMHERLVSIHPFVDGNGRTSRLVMNLILLQNGYPITIIEGDNDKRLAYYDSLEKIQIGEDTHKTVFKLLIANNVKTMLFNYLNLIAPNGDNDNNEKGDYFFRKIEPIL